MPDFILTISCPDRPGIVAAVSLDRTVRRMIESQVLADAIAAHTERRILLNGHKTVVFT